MLQPCIQSPSEITVINFVIAVPPYPATPKTQKIYSENPGNKMEQFMSTAHKQSTIQHENINISILPPKMGTKTTPNCAKTTSFCSIQHEKDNNLAWLTGDLTGKKPLIPYCRITQVAY